MDLLALRRRILISGRVPWYTVTIVPTPADATVVLDGYLPNGSSFKRGTTVTYSVSKYGYYDVNSSVTVTDNISLPVSLTEKPLRTITFVPNVSDTLVYVNDVLLSNNTYTGYDGDTISWDAVKRGYSMQSGNLTISGDATVPITMTPSLDATYLSMRVRESGTIRWKCSSSSMSATILYTDDDGTTWNPITSTTSGASISAVPSKTYRFKYDPSDPRNNQYGNYDHYNCFLFSTPTEVWGPIDSLLSDPTTPLGYAIKRLFTSNTYLYNHKYFDMELNVPTVTGYMFDGMFTNCTALERPAIMNATALASYYSCRNMYKGCTSLTTGPVLSPSVLSTQSYYTMFSGCSNLTSVICLATDISATQCTYEWLKNVSATGTFYCAPSMVNSWPSGDSGVPTGWTIVPLTT